MISLITTLKRTLAVSLLGTVLANPLFASGFNSNDEERNKINSNIQIIENTDKEYSISLFQDRVLKNKKFSNFFEQYKELSANIFEDVDISEKGFLQQKMQKFYNKYCQLCEKENITPFKPKGLLSFLGGTQDISNQQVVFVEKGGEISLVDHTLNTLYWSLEENPFCPSLHPKQILLTLAGHISPKYFDFFQSKSKNYKRSKFQEVDLNVDENSKIKILKLLDDNKESIEYLLNSSPLIMICNMFKNFPSASEMTHSKIHYLDWNFPMREAENKSLFLYFGGIRKGKFVFDFAQEAETLNQWIRNGWFNEQRHNDQVIYGKKDFITDLTNAINKFFFVDGKQYFSFPQDAQAMDKFFAGYLNLVNGLVNFEIKEWKSKEPKLIQFTEEYDFVMEKIENAEKEKKMYSGVSISPYHISITPTANQSKAEDIEFLKQEVNNHKKSYKIDLKKYEEVKEYLPALKEIQEWFKNIHKYLKKNGRTS